MKQFELAVGADTLKFDTDGFVKGSDDSAVGKWTTNDKNEIVLTRAGGSNNAIAVSWSFDSNNRLTIKQNNKTVVSFARTGNELPMFRLDEKNRLFVNPDGDGDLVDGNFEFPLVCKYGLDKDANLIVSINDVESTLKGFISDDASIFRFWFDDSAKGIGASDLAFAGGWARDMTGAEAANEIRLRYDLVDPALQLAGKPLVLPEAATIDQKRNHLFVSYKSKQGVKEIRFTGRLEFGKSNSLIFSIENASTPELKSTKIEVEATFGWARGNGTVIFYVGKIENKTDKTQTLEVKGSLTATVGADKKITWSLNYQKTTGGSAKPAVVKLATALQIETKSSKFTIVYERDGQKQRFEITAQMATAKFNTTVGITVLDEKGNPQAKQVTAFLGVSW